MRQVFSLDLATRTGWAIRDLDGTPAPLPLEAAAGAPLPKVRSGVEDLSRFSGNLGGMFVAFDQWLSDMLAVHQPDVVVFEAPLPEHKGIMAGRIALGLAAITEMVATKSRCRVFEVQVQDVKKFATGKGNSNKAAMMAAARAQGWRFRDDNEADALWLADFAVSCLGK